MATPVELIKGKKQPDLVDVPERLVLQLDGKGGPELAAFGDAVGALYGVAYGLRFARKKVGRSVFKVGPLVARWGAKGEGLSVGVVPPRDTWRWSVQITVPSDTTTDEFNAVVEAVVTKRGGKLEGSVEARRIRLAKVEAARFARILHVGPFATEPASFAKIGTLLEAESLTRKPDHVEVYLSDPRRTASEKLRTVLLAEAIQRDVG